MSDSVVCLPSQKMKRAQRLDWRGTELSLMTVFFSSAGLIILFSLTLSNPSASRKHPLGVE